MGLEEEIVLFRYIGKLHKLLYRKEKTNMSKKRLFSIILCTVMLITSLNVLANSAYASFGEGSARADAELYTKANSPVGSGATAYTKSVSNLTVNTQVKITDAYGYSPGWAYGGTYAYQSASGLTNPKTAQSIHYCEGYSRTLSCSY